MLLRLVLVAALFVPLGAAQSFEVASIRPSQFQSGGGEANGQESVQTSPGRLTMRNVTLRTCIGWAYDVQDFQIVGPLGADRFDITAKAAEPATVVMLRAMLGTLLAERFNLAFHRDTREMSSLALVVAKGGPKLRASAEDAPGVLKPGKDAMVVRHATMAEFVGSLSGPLRIPVVDKTGLTGRYDFTIDASAYFADTRPGEQPDLTAIVMSALREQLGLNLETRKERVDILVIDHVDPRPTQN